MLNKEEQDELINMELRGFSRPLSENIHLLGDILGEVIKEQVGEGILKIIEEIRYKAKISRNNSKENTLQEVMNLISNLSLEKKIYILKSFTLYFHLVNEAEKIEIVRVNRERELHAINAPRKESIREAIYLLKKNGLGATEVQALIDELYIQPVFTAHPTEAKRPALLRLLKEIVLLVQKYDLPKFLTGIEKQNIQNELKNKITLLWRMPEVRSRKPEVVEEAHNVLYHMREVVFDLIPRLHDDLFSSLKEYYPEENFILPNFLRFGSWVGGDRDGNPFVTPDITKDILLLNSQEIINQYILVIKKLRSELIIREANDKLFASIEKDSKDIGAKNNDANFYQYEPYRKKLWFMQIKLQNTILFLKSNITKGIFYSSSDEFLEDLFLLRDSLEDNNASIIFSLGLLSKLIIQVKAFGFHFAELDIREHSDNHERAIEEVFHKNKFLHGKKYSSLDEISKIDLLTKLILEQDDFLTDRSGLSEDVKSTLYVFDVISMAHNKIGKDSVRCYITSFTRSVSDLLEVIFFAKGVGLVRVANNKVEGDLDIVPLFETVDDLENSNLTLKTLFANKLYSLYLKSRNNFQEIMLGFSDSGKDGGYLAANVQLYNAQKKMSLECEANGIKWRFFHGRGGSVGRGGAQAGKAIQASPQGSVRGKLRFTEQGEVVAARYSIPDLAHRHLEAIIHGVLITAKDQFIDSNDKDRENILNQLENDSKEKYKSLIYGNTKFWDFFSNVTPYEFIALLNIASRPTARGTKSKVEDIRAITWGFSLTQTRLMLNSWYGVGTALDKIISREGIVKMQNLYINDEFFKVTIDNCQQALAKTDIKISNLYAVISTEHFVDDIFADINSEYELTKVKILEITGQKEILDNKKLIKQSVKLRNPYTDPLNCIQVDLLQQIRTEFKNAVPGDKELVAATLLSISGIAAAMQETG